MENRSETRFHELTNIALFVYIDLRRDDKIPTPMVVRHFAKKATKYVTESPLSDDEHGMLHEAISRKFYEEAFFKIYDHLREIYFGEPKSFELRERVQVDDVEQQDRLDRARDMNAERF